MMKDINHIKLKLNNLIAEVETHVQRILLSNYTNKSYFELELSDKELLEVHVVNDQIKWIYLRTNSRPIKGIMWDKLTLQKKVEILEKLLKYDKS